MIPRTKVNYRLHHLARALLVSERGGGYKKRLVAQLREYMGEDLVLLTPSGRGSLYYILRTIARPRVLIPSYTCKAVTEAVLLAGKEPVFVEVEDDGFNMSVEALSRLVDERSAVIATHQFGIPCRIEEILRLCRHRGALVIEDAAASLGSRVNGKLTGTFGDVAFFSFDSTKLINVPLKGGFIVAKDNALFEAIKKVYYADIRPLPLNRKLRLIAQGALLVALGHHSLYRLFHNLVFERRGRYTMDSAELNLELNDFYQFDMANWQAFLAHLQMSRVESIVEARRALYAQYLRDLEGCLAFRLPPEDAQGQWACIRFPIRVSGDKIAYYRAAAKQGVDFAFSFTFTASPDHFHRAKRLESSVLDLPYYLRLSAREKEQVVSVLHDIDGRFAHESRQYQVDGQKPREPGGGVQHGRVLGREGA